MLDSKHRTHPLVRSMLLIAVAGLVLAAPGARGESAWVRGEVRLNVRTGPGTEYRIVQTLQTGDRLEVLERREGWTHVQGSEGQGWIPAGFLLDEPPPAVRLKDVESELDQARSQLSQTENELEELRTAAATCSDEEEQRVAAIEQLTRENRDLKQGARWPYLITGAAILAAGMMLGTLMRALFDRGRRNRIRF